MPSPGRNDPCPCGSGRKYKRCCLAAEPATDTLWQRQRRLNQELPGRLLELAVQAYGEEVVDEAWRAFMLWDDDSPGFTTDTPHIQVFMPWLLYEWTPAMSGTERFPDAPAGEPIAAAYLRRRPGRADDFERRYVEAALASTFSFHEIVDCRPGQGFTVRDLLTGEEHAVTEQLGSEMAEVGQILFARVVRLGELAVLDGNSPVYIPALEKGPILALRRAIREREGEVDPQALREHGEELRDIYLDIVERLLDPPPPELTNTDGDPLVPHILHFEISSPAQAFEALQDLAGGEDRRALLEGAELDGDGAPKRVTLPWLVAGNAMHASWDNTIMGQLTIDGSHLTAEVNSEPRAARIRELIEQRLGEAVRHRETTVESLQDQLAEHRASGAGEAHDAERRTREQFPWLEDSPIPALRSELGL